MPRRVLPVPPSFPLARLVALCRTLEPLGVWLEAARPPVRLVVPGPGGRRLILLAYDLGTLLAVAPRVVVWDGAAIRTIVARALRRARRLEIEGQVGVRDAFLAAWSPAAAVNPSAVPHDVQLRQPIDCVMEGPVA